jgi:hypothetical protein
VWAEALAEVAQQHPSTVRGEADEDLKDNRKGEAAEGAQWFVDEGSMWVEYSERFALGERRRTTGKVEGGICSTRGH